MKKLILLITVSILLVTSCKKDEVDKYTSTKLVGSWYVRYNVKTWDSGFVDVTPYICTNDTVISNITIDPSSSNKVLFDNIYGIPESSKISISMINTNIIVEKQSYSLSENDIRNISGSGIYNNDNEFILTVYTGFFMALDTFQLSFKRK